MPHRTGYVRVAPQPRRKKPAARAQSGPAAGANLAILYNHALGCWYEYDPAARQAQAAGEPDEPRDLAGTTAEDA